MDKGPWYNKDIYSRFHGSLFEYFITHARTDIYNLICFLVAHDKIKPAYEDEENSIGDRLIPKHVTADVLESLGTTINIIEIWLKLLEDNYEVIY